MASRSFFSSRIYNNNKQSKHLPVFSILSDKKDFGVDSIAEWKESHKFENLFVVCNGQQTLPFEGEESSMRYGHSLAGIWIEKYREYKIDRKGSLASDLYDEFHKNSLVIDILDTKYNWETSPASNSTSMMYTMDLLESILPEEDAPQPTIFLVGFSRGAAFALKLADKYRGSRKIDYIFTIDPVLASWKEQIHGHAEKQKDIWEIKLPAIASLKFRVERCFPVLCNPAPKTKIYNVFQRRSLITLNMAWVYAWPIGCAVHGAYSYDGKKDVVAQYDMTFDNHFKLREHYVPRIFSMVKEILERK